MAAAVPLPFPTAAVSPPVLLCGESSFRKVACVVPCDLGGLWEGAGKEGPTVVRSPQKCPLPQEVRGGGHRFCVFPFESLKKGSGWGRS